MVMVLDHSYYKCQKRYSLLEKNLQFLFRYYRILDSLFTYKKYYVKQKFARKLIAEPAARII